MIFPEKILVIKKIFRYLIPFVALFLIIGCNDDPTDLGVDLLEQDGVEVLKLNSYTDSLQQYSYDFNDAVVLGGATHILLGKAENITSHILMKFVFSIPDSIKSELEKRNLTVIESYIELTKSYRFGDSSAYFDYGVYEVKESWSSSSFTSDSFATLNYGNIDLSFQREIDNDSVYSFRLDTTLVSSWLQNYADTNIASNNGVLLSSAIGTQKVLGFTAFNVDGENDPRLRIVVQKPGEYIDTLIGYISSDLSIVLGERANVGSENLVIQSSLVTEVKLLFDLSKIPDNVVINSAILTFTVDTIKTKIGSNANVNKLYVQLLTDSVKNEVSKDYNYILTRSGSSISGSITNIVRAWNNDVENQGFLVKSATELYGVDIFAFRGSNAPDLSERPKLEIVYSRKK